MTKLKITFISLLHAIGVLIYIIGVRYAVEYGSTLFPDSEGFTGFILFLLLFVLSASTMAVLIFGRPVYMFLSGMKSESVRFLLYTIGWLMVITILAFSLTTIFYHSPVGPTTTMKIEN